MGWKAECIVVNNGGPGYFGTLPLHEHDKAMSVLGEILEGSHFCSAGLSNYLDELTPMKSDFAFGAYEMGCILSDWRDVPGCVKDGNKNVLQRIISRYPSASILVLELSSVVNAFGYALYEKQHLIRSYAGDAMSGITVDLGDPLPEEEQYFRESTVREKERFFHRKLGSEMREHPASSFGEVLAFAVTARFFGKPLDKFKAESLVVERFRRLSLWQRCLARIL